MPPLKDLTGNRYGYLVVVSRAENRITPNGGARTFWNCVCDCGKECAVSGKALTSARTVSCGCKSKELISLKNSSDLTGKVFGRLTVLRRDTERHGSDKKRRAFWICRCECGNEVSVVTDALRNGDTRSCGCYKREKAISDNTTHGLSNHKLYSIWGGMIQRCENQSSQAYDDYGARGISVCEEWRNDFKAFYDWATNSGYAEGLTIDRVDVNGGYSPSNCRWATPKEQANNRRSNVFVDYDGCRMSATELAAKLGISTYAVTRNYNIYHV